MKKILIVFALMLAIVGSVYATEVKIEARTGVSYYQANLANTDLIAGVVSVGADMYCFEKNSIELGFNAQFLYGWGTARYITTAKEYKEYKGLRKESLRDNMDNLEIILTDLSEETAKRLAEKHKPQGLDQNKEVARMGGHAAKVAREDIERNLGERVITKQNRLNYEYKDELEIETK